jgi:hypothetical protein
MKQTINITQEFVDNTSARIAESIIASSDRIRRNTNFPDLYRSVWGVLTECLTDEASMSQNAEART